ncbi:hypothetical protein SAMN05216436_10731 [bacterium A37T11]|nr:hypothetical protein SAMN05216436_10731 [bacterium A37T11]
MSIAKARNVTAIYKIGKYLFNSGIIPPLTGGFEDGGLGCGAGSTPYQRHLLI